MLLFAFKVYTSGLYPIGSIKQVWENLNRMAEPDAVPVAGEGAPPHAIALHHIARLLLHVGRHAA